MSSQDKRYLELEKEEQFQEKGLDLSLEKQERPQEKDLNADNLNNAQANDEVYEDPASSEMIRDGYKAVLYCQKSFKYSAILLSISLLCAILTWYRLFFDLNILTTLQGVLLSIAVLVQSSISANTAISYFSVVLGQLNKGLQLTIDVESNPSDIRGQMRFLRALCKGSISSTTAVTLFIPIIVFFAFSSADFYKPEYSSNLPEVLTLSILMVYMLTNILSLMVMRRTKRLAENVLNSY